MNKGHQALGCILIVIGLILNPFVLASLFSNDGNITSSVILWPLICVELLIVLLGVSVYKQPRSWVLILGVWMLSTIAMLALSVSADRFYGAVLLPETDNLLFPAYSTAIHETSEFKLKVQINNLGFRGPETHIEKSKKRILIIGDSFTFGWGVIEDSTWIHRLAVKYPNVEFLNLGQGGNHPGDYVQVAKRSVPRLKPDFVMVCVLQGNDLHQLMRLIEFEKDGLEKSAKPVMQEPFGERINRYLSIVYPNITTRISHRAYIQPKWKLDAATLLQQLSENQLSKYHQIDGHLRVEFESGRLNPALIYESVHHPKMFLTSVDTSEALVQKAIVRLQHHLAELKEICDKNDARFLVLDIPNRPYGFPRTVIELEQLGFEVSGADSLNGSTPTSIATKRLGLPLLQPTLQDSTEALFYTHDGHWNDAGNRTFTRELVKKLDSYAEWKRFLTY